MKKFIICLTAASVLTGCIGHMHPLTTEAATPFIGGELVHASGSDNRLVLQTAQRRYEARGFTVEDRTDREELRRRYLNADRQHWNRIFAGHDTDHKINAIEVKARAADGQELACVVVWRNGVSPEGECRDTANAVYAIRFAP